MSAIRRSGLNLRKFAVSAATFAMCRDDAHYTVRMKANLDLFEQNVCIHTGPGEGTHMCERHKDPTPSITVN